MARGRGHTGDGHGPNHLPTPGAAMNSDDAVEAGPALEADAWQQAFQAVAPQLEQIRTLLKKPPSLAILQVDQMDAARLDLEMTTGMTAMLKEQLIKVFSLVQQGLLLQYKPELNAILDLLICRVSIWVDRPTSGNALMNLHYRDERSSNTLAAAGKDTLFTNLKKLGVTDESDYTMFGNVKDVVETVARQRYIQKEKLSGNNGEGFVYQLAEMLLDESFKSRLEVFVSQEKTKEEDVSTGPLFVLTTSVKNNTQVLINCKNNEKLLG